MNSHPITAASFALIDREIGPHPWSPSEYPLVRRAIHATADFELRDLFQFSPEVIPKAIAALQQKTSVIVDVRMVAVAVNSRLAQAEIPLHCALDRSPPEDLYIHTGQTRTAQGMQALALDHPQGIFVVGNAPSALITLADLIQQHLIQPALVIGVPVGFIGVEEAKARLAQLSVPQIQITGRKGGSPVAAAIVNQLVELSQQGDPEAAMGSRSDDHR